MVIRWVFPWCKWPLSPQHLHRHSACAWLPMLSAMAAPVVALEASYLLTESNCQTKKTPIPKHPMYGCFLKWWYPQNTPKWSFVVGKPMVVGYHHFRKPPYIGALSDSFLAGSLLWISESTSDFKIPWFLRYNIQIFSSLKKGCRNLFSPG